MPYTRTSYVNDGSPPLSAANLNKAEGGIQAATAAGEAAQSTASSAQATATSASTAAAAASTAAAAAQAAANLRRTQAQVRDDAAAMLTGGSHTNVTATRVGDVVNLVGSGGGSGATVSTDLTDSATLLRTTGNALKTAGVLTFGANTIAVATGAFPQSAVVNLTVDLGLKATTAQLAGDVKAVFNLTGTNPPRPNTSATGQVILWVYQAGNAPALNGTAAGGTYASLTTDLHLTFA